MFIQRMLKSSLHFKLFVHIWSTPGEQEGAGLQPHPPPEETDKKENTSF
jgi:hypothetical protein